MESTEFKKNMWLVSTENGQKYRVEKVARNKQSVTVRWMTHTGHSRQYIYRVPMYRAMVIFRKDGSP